MTDADVVAMRDAWQKGNWKVLADYRARFAGQLARVIVHQREHLFVTARKQAHRPVGAEHQPVLAEGLEDSVEIRLEIGRFPVRMVRFGDHAGDLAEDVRRSCEFTNQLTPRRKRTLLDGWFGDVIEDERLLRKLFDQLNCYG